MLQSKSTRGAKTAVRRQRERLQRRGDILAAASRAFAENGYHETSIESIAREAGYASGTIYLYFKDKESLYIALFAEKISEMVQRIETDAAKAADPLDGLRRATRSHLDFCGTNREFFDLFFRQRMGPPNPKQRQWNAVRACYERHVVAIQKQIEGAQRKRLIRKGDSRRFATAMLGISIQVIRESAHAAKTGALIDEADFVLDLFLNGVMKRTT